QSHWGEGGANWFGHSRGSAFLHGIALFLFLYTLRYPIIIRTGSAAGALAWYVLLLAALLPWIWLFVVTDWDNEAGSKLANWLCTPIALLSVPTVFLFLLLAARVHLTLGTYIALSLIEVTLLVPMWLVFWVHLEFYLLGWVGL